MGKFTNFFIIYSSCLEDLFVGDRDMVDYKIVGNYDGVNKAHFTVALNIACDNLEYKGCGEILKEAQRSKGGIADEQIKNVQSFIDERLREIRNYFSHYYHNDKPLEFEANDCVKEFLEETFKTAVEKLRGGFHSNEYKVETPKLFEKDKDIYKITAAGVIFLTSFFCHRSYVYRMLGGIKGFKRSDKVKMDNGQKIDYGFTRRLLSFYSLRDSYSVGGAASEELITFRDILGYLSKIPEKAIAWRKDKGLLTKEDERQIRFCNSMQQDSEEDADSETDEQKEKAEAKNFSLRKADKFMLFAVRFIEDWAKKNELEVEFARYGKTIIEKRGKKENRKEKRIVEFVSDESEAKRRQYYIKNNHSIIRIKEKDKEPVWARISENELKYLVLAIIDDKGKKAISEIGRHIFGMYKKIGHKSYK
jgi:hypothetical protein